MAAYTKEIAIALIADMYGIEVSELTELLERIGCLDDAEKTAFNHVSIGILAGIEIGKCNSFHAAERRSK